MNFSIDPNGERATRDGGVTCPRCSGPAERRAVQISGSPQLFVTPSGLVMTEDTLRQLLMAQLSPAPGATPDQMHIAIDAMVRGLRQARDGEGMDTELLEAINRSIAEAQNQQAPPAAAKVMENLPKCKWKKGENWDDECAICLGTYAEGDDLSLLPCSHRMHTECLTPWLKQTNSCPLCRFQLDTDSPEYERQRRQQDSAPAPEGLNRRPTSIITDTSPRAPSRHPVLTGEFGVHSGDSQAERTAGAPLAGSLPSSASVGAVSMGNPTISPSHLSSGSATGSGTGSSPASRGTASRGTPGSSNTTGGMRRGFLQSRGTRGFGEDEDQNSPSGMRRGFLQDRVSRGFGEDRSPQQAAGGNIAGVSGIWQVPREDLRVSPQNAGNRTLRMPGAERDRASGGGDHFIDSAYSWSPGDACTSEAYVGGSSSHPDPRSWTVRKLKGVLRQARVPHEDCVEKEDLVRRSLDSRADLARFSREYDARLAEGDEDVGAMRMPRSSPLGASGGAGGNARAWSPTTSAAASVLSNESWLSRGGGGASRDPLQAAEDIIEGLGGVGSAAAGGTVRLPTGSGVGSGVRLESLAGRSPVQERNTAAHSYARLPRQINVISPAGRNSQTSLL